jgi:DNA polymerase III subunit chi
MKVEFHSGVADKVVAATRFLNKAHAAGTSVVVCGDPQLLDRLDGALWTAEALSFVPHVRLKARSLPAAQMTRTPIWLVDDPAAVASRKLLLNLGPEMAAAWDQFERVVEIVSVQAPDVDAGRRRWRQYGASSQVELVHRVREGST